MSRKIKSIHRFHQDYKNFSFSDPTNTADEEYKDLTVLLDPSGNVTEEIKYDSNEEVEEKNSYEYNEQGKLLSHTLLYAIENVTEKRVLSRNDKGLLISEMKYYGSDSGECTKYEYNAKDNVSAIEHYDEEGQFLSREEIKYDDNGSLNERATYDASKKLIAKTTFTPPVENLVEEIEYDGSGKILHRTAIKFNEQGKEISTRQTTAEGKLISSVRNSYDERGNLIEKIHKDFYSKTIRYEYNDKDLLITMELFDETGMLLRKNMYEYDDDGNVTTEQTYEMDTTRGGRDKHYGMRYEYLFWE